MGDSCGESSSSMMINYYGQNTSAREIADQYRGGFPSISEREISD